MASLEQSSLTFPGPSAGRLATDGSSSSLLLESALTRIPAKLPGVAGARFPLLEAVHQHDPIASRALILAGALTHQRADERRTAEYLLRHRERLSTVGARRLLASARCAVEMELRHAQCDEVATEPTDLALRADQTPAARTEDPSVGELVVHFVGALADETLPAALCGALTDAVATFMELACRHARYSAGLSLIAMRPSARPDARLVTHLRRGGLSRVWSRRIARLLIGADGTAPDTALLWWVARRAHIGDVPVQTRQSWLRDIRGLIASAASARDVRD